MQKCPKCGYENTDQASYCNLCHEIFKKEVSNKPKDTVIVNPQKKKDYFKLLYFLVLTLPIIASVIYFNKDKIKDLISNEDFVLLHKNNFLPGDFFTIKTPNFIIYHHNQEIADFLKKE